jgi:hypothetical protein
MPARFLGESEGFTPRSRARCSLQLRVELLVGGAEQAGQRGSTVMLAAGVYLAQAGALSEEAQETPALSGYVSESDPFPDHNGPRQQGEQQEDNQNHQREPARPEDQIQKTRRRPRFDLHCKSECADGMYGDGPSSEP